MADATDSPGIPDLDLGATVRGFVDGQKLFNRYTLRKVLGRGGMGVVWLARDERLAQDVALKFLPDTVRLDLAAADELKHETRRSLKLTHHHIVRIYDFAENDYTSAVAMEYVDGATLSALRIARPGKVFETADLGNWVRELCEALEYAHQWAKIVHRDLKPANLMVTAGGELKITDFGIARSISDSMSKMSMRPSTSGTLVYMSPQQALGQKATPLDDVYSLGATLYELLTGKPPFYSGNIQHQLDNVEPPTIAARRLELGVAGAPVPEAWEKTIAACLAKNPAERPQGVREVALGLGISLSSPAMETQAPMPKPAAAAPATPRKMASPAGRKRALAACLAAILLASAAAGAVYYFRVTVPAQKARQAEAARQAEEAHNVELAAAQQAADDAKRAENERQQELAAAKERELAALAEVERQKAEAAQLKLDHEKDATRGNDSKKTTQTGSGPRSTQPATQQPRSWEKYVPSHSPGRPPSFPGFPR